MSNPKAHRAEALQPRVAKTSRTFTTAEIGRLVRAANEAGIHVGRIEVRRGDVTLVVSSEPISAAPANENLDAEIDQWLARHG